MRHGEDVAESFAKKGVLKKKNSVENIGKILNEGFRTVCYACINQQIHTYEVVQLYIVCLTHFIKPDDSIHFQ
jgi:hypothetical protein